MLLSNVWERWDGQEKDEHLVSLNKFSIVVSCGLSLQWTEENQGSVCICIHTTTSKYKMVYLEKFNYRKKLPSTKEPKRHQTKFKTFSKLLTFQVVLFLEQQCTCFKCCFRQRGKWLTYPYLETIIGSRLYFKLIYEK